MENIIRSAYIGMIVGDAAGYTVDGMGKGHISASFGEIMGFIDPIDALKGHPERWKKPGLYSALSQLSLCAAAATRGRNLGIEPLRRVIADADFSPDSPESLFRSAGRLIAHFTDSCREHGMPVLPVAATAHGIPVSASAALSLFQARMPGHGEVIAYASALGGDIDASCASALFSRVLYSAVFGTVHEALPHFFAVQAGEAADWSAANAPELFSLGLNSDKVTAVFREYEKLFLTLSLCSSREGMEKAIIAAVNRRVKTPVTRCTVDHPFSLLPFSVILTEQYKANPEKLLLRCAEEGGAASVLASLSGMLAGALMYEGFVPEVFSAGLINRRFAESLIEKIAVGRADSGDAVEFLKGEIALTAKESQERDARLKHRKSASPTDKKEKKKSDQRSLTKHVVESWTKVDKARWKKEQQHVRDSDDET